MATHNFENINEQNLIKTINSYFKDLNSEKTNTEMHFDNEENDLKNILNRNTLKRKINLYIINDVLNKIIVEDSIDNRDSFYQFILKENLLSIIIKNIFVNLSALLTSLYYEKKHIYLNLISKFGSLTKINSDVDLNFILSCEILKFFSFGIFQDLYSKVDALGFNDNEIIEYKRCLKNFNLKVNLKIK